MRLGYNLQIPVNTPQCAQYSINFEIRVGGLSGALVQNFRFNIILNRAAWRDYQNASTILNTPELVIFDNNRSTASSLNFLNIDYGQQPYAPSQWNWDYRNITQSPDIWNRRTNDGLEQFQNPTHSIANPQNANSIYVRIHNRSCVATPASELEMYWTIARNWEPWAKDWLNYNHSSGVSVNNKISHQLIDRPLGNEIVLNDPFKYNSNATSIPISGFAPGEKRNISHPWIVPNPAWYLDQPQFPIQFNRQFGTPVICLLARLKETWKPQNGNPNEPALGAATNIVDYVSNFNNFATRNTHIMNSTDGYLWSPISGNPRTGGGVIAVVPQPGNNPPPASIVIIADTPSVIVSIGDDGQPIEEPLFPINFPEYGHLELFMDALLWERWIAGGAEGENIEIIADQVIRITNPFRAVLHNIQLAEGEMGWLGAEAEMYPEAAPSENLEYTFSIGNLNSETGLTEGSPTHFVLNILKDPIVENELDWNNITSLKTLTQYTTVKVFPNPAKDILYIEDKTIDANTLFMIHDMQGKLVKQIVGAQAKGVFEAGIDIQGLQTGVYHLSIHNSTGQRSVRFTIE